MVLQIAVRDIGQLTDFEPMAERALDRPAVTSAPFDGIAAIARVIRVDRADMRNLAL
jgi:hypothetical protein